MQDQVANNYTSIETLDYNTIHPWPWDKGLRRNLDEVFGRRCGAVLFATWLTWGALFFQVCGSLQLGKCDCSCHASAMLSGCLLFLSLALPARTFHVCSLRLDGLEL